MATTKDNNNSQHNNVDAVFRDNINNIVPVDLEQEMRKSFIDYAMSVISDRALPDIRDGLKPVHRRILFSMFSQGFTPDKPYRKCATTVGNVLGHFHPHGDAAVYDSMVRLAQDFSMRHTMVDGHGNFGSRDGDPPAAYRYTEARLTKIAVEMMRDINKNTVDFKPNFDEQEMEPIVLPSRFPNLLVNGSTGIAVGMATDIPPHNLGETIDAVVMRINNPDCDLEDIMEILPGPDFPTGGTILGLSGIRETYRTGKGRITVRSAASIEDMPNNRHKIVVHDLPYMVNKARLIEKMADLVKEKRIDGISMIRDESDRNEEIRIVIELKRDANPQVVLNRLYKMTQLQDNFNANMLALVPDAQGRYEPKVVTLLDCLDHYIAHQKSVVLRRTKFDLDKALARQHIVQGLLKAIDNIDEVIRIIRSSSNEETAKQALCERFDFSIRQAQHIVDMRLGRLTALERERLQKELDELIVKIEYFNRIINESSLLNQVICDELTDLKTRYANKRRTVIEPYSLDEFEDEELVKEEEVVITLTHFGYVKRQPVDTYQQQHRGGRGISGLQTREDDFVETLVTTSTHDHLLFFTNTGRVFRLKGYQIPEAGRQAKGQAIVNLLQLVEGEKVRTVITVHEFNREDYLLMATARGMIKKTSLYEYANIQKNGLIAINLRPDDEVIGVKVSRLHEEVILATAGGYSLRFDTNDIRNTGRNTFGVSGIKLRHSDKVIGMAAVDEERHLLVISKNGYGKRSEFNEYRIQNRGGKGLITYKPTEQTGDLAGIASVNDEDDIIIINDAGIVIRVATKEIPILSRVTKGVRLMRTAGQIVDLAVVQHDDEQPNEKPDVIPDTVDLGLSDGQVAEGTTSVPGTDDD
ncbi:DNA gyrase subunit A [Mageeibacillus indolicus]|uniref:DNA gyrase subunit A n=1 Tax=Mageeibacillus indolicus TaxID=884684 RepID=UPI0004DCB511|nr:DNA gyrase subunit A [Mageeibacillus indolicus]KFA56797.1 DNA gyrase subunit A [Mageeibacillus indolicus 0009-5]